MKKLNPALISIILSITPTLHSAIKEQKTINIYDDLNAFNIQQDLAFAIGLEAYLYALPLYMMETTMQKMTTQKGNEGNALLGTFGHATRLLTPKDDLIVTPNNDTLYSSAWLDLSKDAYVLYIPEIKDRYYSFALYDAWTNAFELLSNRTRGDKEGTYLIVGPKWQGNVPNNSKKIVAPTNLVWLLARVLVENETDIPNVLALQKQSSITPLKSPSPTETSSTKTRYKEHKEIPAELQLFDQIGQYFATTPPQPNEKALLTWFETIGISSKGLHLNTASAAGLARVKTAATQLMDNITKKNSTRIHGWSVFMIPKDFGDNYLLRAATAYKGLAALPAEEALYPLCEIDAYGNPLDGKNNYVLHFNKDQLPPVDGFWSLSMYSQKTFNFVENEINRYSLGDRTPGVVYGTDSSLDIYLQNKKPKDKEGNWLPAPTGAFYVILRLYDPQEQALNGNWKVPGIIRK